jgi:hypothetical protein
MIRILQVFHSPPFQEERNRFQREARATSPTRVVSSMWWGTITSPALETESREME